MPLLTSCTASEVTVTSHPAKRTVQLSGYEAGSAATPGQFSPGLCCLGLSRNPPAMESNGGKQTLGRHSVTQRARADEGDALRR
ncbi:hypothetical protein MRX96_043313 [Rhipicephalus microplus]